ncbi:MAG TPA: hypothetical protein VMB02_15080 [Candidatus Aquilonibacter sp.]|nr:hypothetical protein [Candidatus Aquilonibacter sp.]
MDVHSTQALSQQAVQQEELGSLSTTAQTPAKQAGMAKLEKAAQDFESIMINSLWSEMKQGSLGSDNGDDLDDPSSSSLDDVGMQMVSEAMAKAGGMGIGKMIVKALESKV